MRYGFDNYGECHVCGEFAELCMDCGCCEHCCGNGFECPSEIDEDPEYDGWKDPMDELYVQKKLTEVKRE